jgi:hypothetical protein
MKGTWMINGCLQAGALAKPNSFPTLLYIIFTVSMVLQGMQNMNKSMHLGPFQNKGLFQNKFLFLFCRLLKYFSLPILLSEQIVRK